MENQQANPEKGSDSEIKALESIVSSRRLELGIKPGSMPTQITAAMPAREMSPEEVQAREEQAQRMALAEQKARRHGMFTVLCEKAGARYAKCNFKTYVASNERQKTALAACEEYASTLIERIADCQNLVLYGPVGTGKDHLAFAVCGAATLAHGKFVGWINGQDWFGEIRDEMRDAGESERRIIMRLVSPEVLVVSDPLPPFGALTQHQSTMLYRLVHARYSSGKPTIVTLNVANDDEADSRLGVPTWDRVCDGAWKILCNWASHRKPARIINAK